MVWFSEKSGGYFFSTLKVCSFPINHMLNESSPLATPGSEKERKNIIF